jgi:lipoyl(octanoyl) transferase
MLIRKLGLVDYQSTWQAMKDFTDQRDATTEDELWLVQHSPVFTQGQAGKAEHVLAPGAIPVVQVDRGGQVTYHGPGQWLVYLLVDIRRHNLGVRDLVDLIEQSIVSVLAQLDIASEPRPDAPGVYVDGQKIASLGLRVRRGCSYHGLAFNVDMDLEPFSRINPCGYEGLQVTSVRRVLGEAAAIDSDAVADALLSELITGLGGDTSAASASTTRSWSGHTIS